MKHLTRNSLLGTIALVAALSAPMAFAQSTEAGSAQDPAATQTPPATTEATTGNTSADASAATDAGADKKSWADVDANQDGNLTQAEAAQVPALAEVFTQADANADGSLTGDEYRSFVSKSQTDAGNTQK